MAFRKLFLVLALFGVSVSSGREIDLENPSAKLKRFLSDVIYVVEVGDRERFSKRLPESIVVNLHGQAVLKAVGDKHLTEFCKVSGVQKVEESSADGSAAKIEIYFGPEAELVKVANEMEKKITLDRGATYWTWWDGKNVINRAAIFVAIDKFSGAALEDKLIEQLMGAFGLPAKSKEFDESCISSKEQVLTNLQPLDKAILEFYYRAIPAGTKPQDVNKIFVEKWSEKR
jgi:hypothetical protein